MENEEELVLKQIMRTQIMFLCDMELMKASFGVK